MTTVFISYARDDRDQAQGLAQELTMRGADVWWDREILSGEHYIQAILRKIQLADHAVLLLSGNSAASTWVAFEVGAVRLREILTERDILRIAQLDDCDVPGFIGERQAAPLAPGNHDDVRGLARALGLPEDVDYKPPAGGPDASLQVFKAGGQWMELVANSRGLDCVLVDTGEMRARLQWSLNREQASQLDVQGIHMKPPRPDRGWALFSIQRQGEWRWTPALFTHRDGPPAEQVFRQRAFALIEEAQRDIW